MRHFPFVVISKFISRGLLGDDIRESLLSATYKLTSN